MAKKKVKQQAKQPKQVFAAPVARKQNGNKNLAIAGFIINLFIPGLGTIIAKDNKTGLYQLILTLVSYPLMLVLIGFITYAVAWIWALVTSIKMLRS